MMAVTKGLLVGVLALGGFFGLGLTSAMTVMQPPAGNAAATWLQIGTSSPPTADRIVETVVSYAESNRLDDPLVEVEPGVWVKSSNYHGVVVDGTAYYYSLSPHQSFDPLSRGEVSPDHIEIVADLQDGGIPIRVYTIHQSEWKTTAM